MSPDFKAPRRKRFVDQQENLNQRGRGETGDGWLVLYSASPLSGRMGILKLKRLLKNIAHGRKVSRGKGGVYGRRVLFCHNVVVLETAPAKQMRSVSKQLFNTAS